MWSNEKNDKPWTIHPEGPCMAICRDIYNVPNPKFGQLNSFGKPEPKEKVVIEFLTEEPVEFNGKMEPSLIKVRFNPSWGEKSGLRGFVSGWVPALGKLEVCDPEQLIGKGAYLNIVHKPDEKNPDKVWANIRSAAPPPKGATIPRIPADFVRHKDKDNAADQGVGSAAQSQGPGGSGAFDEDAPF